jgi:hypothetical protein
MGNPHGEIYNRAITWGILRDDAITQPDMQSSLTADNFSVTGVIRKVKFLRAGHNF